MVARSCSCNPGGSPSSNREMHRAQQSRGSCLGGFGAAGATCSPMLSANVNSAMTEQSADFTWNCCIGRFYPQCAYSRPFKTATLLSVWTLQNCKPCSSDGPGRGPSRHGSQDHAL